MSHKVLGQVFTPKWIVNLILDEVGYIDKNILNKKIIDPACGDGAFLIQIVDRLINQAKKEKNITKIKSILENNVYGIEIDKKAYDVCINTLNDFVKSKLNADIDIKWNIFNDNTLIKYKDFKDFFDYVVGNPPYIRIHNLDSQTRKFIKNTFKFNQGTLDIYLSFFELGLEMLNENGVLGYITPNSYLRNSSYKNFRNFLKNQQKIKTLIDFKSNKIFKKFSTYTAITVIDFKHKKDSFEYKELKDNKIQKVNDINFLDLNDKNWSFGNKEDMDFLIKLDRSKYKISDFFEVQYGFATLRDRIFINKIKEQRDNYVLFNGFWIEKEIVKKIVKGSTYRGKDEEIEYIIFPYKLKNNRFVALTEKELQYKFPKAYEYLLLYKNELLKRDIEKNKNWYEFGRSQGLKNSHKEKIVISSLIKDRVNFYFLDKDIYVYSGIFITKKKDEYDWKWIESVLSSKDFFKYIIIKGKDFSGGYKSLTSNLIKEFPLWL